MKWLVSLLIFFISSASFGQGFTYSYVDPCSKKTKSIYLSGNENVTVNYLGYVSSFNRNDFQNGSFESWVQSIQTLAAGKPCDEMKTQTQKSQNMVITQNLISTLTSITAASTMNIASSSSNALSNSIGNASNETNESPQPNKKDNGNNNTTTTGNNTNPNGNQTSGQNSGSGSSNQSTSGSPNQQGGSTPNTNQPTQGGNQPTSPSVNNPSSQNNTQSGTNSPQTGTNNTQSGTNSPQTGTNNTQSGTNTAQPNSSSGSNTNKNEPNTNNGGATTGSNNNQTGSNTNNSNNNTNNSGGGNTGSNGGNSGGSGGSGGNTDSKPKTDNTTTTPTDSKSGGNGGTTNSVSNASEATSSSGSSSGSGSGGAKSNVRVGSIIGTGDIVAIRSEEDGSNQFKGTMSVTKSNTDNTRAKGSLLNFTTTVNNTNLTLYAAFSNKKRTNTLITANSSMIDRDWNFFNTSTVLESKRFNKLSVMCGLNFTVGALYDEPFTNLSGVVGGFYPFKVSKKLSGNILMLGVYSPFTKFYEGKWWTSGWLVVPFSSWDYTISKNFKYNVSFSGTYEVKGNFLQYQILTGGKIML